MFTSKIIPIQDIVYILDFLSQDYELFYPRKKGDNYFISKQENNFEVEFPKYRAEEPIKSFLLPAKEDFSKETKKPFALCGIKACDLNSLAIMDYVYLEGDFKDPYYAKRREDFFIFSSDCASFKETCFCTSLGFKPYPEKGFDLNLVKLKEEEYFLQVGSLKGENFLKEKGLNFINTDSVAEKKLNDTRIQITEKVTHNADGYLSHNLKDSLTAAVRENSDSDIWAREALRCVECGACTAVCPDCHCFFLITKKNSFDKLRAWDSCLLRSYALVAGGANPRTKLSERLRNRFIKKMDFFPKVLNTFGCTGCGRCVDACVANIDIRKVLNELASLNIKK